MLQTQRVVITGIGVISPIGCTKEAFWESLIGGRSGVRPLEHLPSGILPASYGAEVWDFQGRAEEFLPVDKEQTKAIRKQLKVMCRESQMGVAAAQRAMADAGLRPGQYDPDRIGVSFGSDYMLTLPEDFIEPIQACINSQGRFEFDRWALEGMSKLEPLWLLKYLPNMPASHFAIFNDLRGPNNSITQREASANLAVGEAFEILRRGDADVMVAGSTGTRLHPMKTIHAFQQEQLADSRFAPEQASRPFDRDRTGMVLGEGAGAVVLETLSYAQARGAKIYAEVLAAASHSVAERRLLARRDRAIELVLRSLLDRAAMHPDQIGHLHAHGLSTHSSDREEAQAIQAVFGQRQKPVPIVAAKSYFGNLGAGSGLVELVASLLALEHGQLFATLNYQTPDPECPIYVVREAAQPPGSCFININVTPQGQAAGVLIRKYEG
ncbi:MAG: beta-ketoacyl-[acyl-carrier-protein] synthase family protein [Thermoguttaceae bacterium]|nr:beta-ketoacyl-[acyl-carrier-protein] synthase family protein [Thermoguttaceae bacterium]MDW8037634.1 beta-ketoacyl-[acyl-carrier-protein] synthase family protein [Thermoguttaceae bacterium]